MQITSLAVSHSELYFIVLVGYGCSLIAGAAMQSVEYYVGGVVVLVTRLDVLVVNVQSFSQFDRNDDQIRPALLCPVN